MTFKNFVPLFTTLIINQSAFSNHLPPSFSEENTRARTVSSRKNSAVTINFADLTPEEIYNVHYDNWVQSIYVQFPELGVASPAMSSVSLRRIPEYSLAHILISLSESLPFIEALDLDENALRILPIEIGRFHFLKYLSLESNNLEDLPNEICYLAALEEINLFNNRIVIFPEILFEFGKLSKLDLGFKLLHLLPEKICCFPFLKELYLDCNFLTEISIEMDNLTQLNILSVSQNRITKLPHTVTAISPLQTLVISGNPLIVSADPNSGFLGYQELYHHFGKRLVF